MKRSRFTEERIVGFIRDAEAGMQVKALCRKGGFSDSTFYKWQTKYSGIDVLSGEFDTLPPSRAGNT